jgi:hypothetical protein
LRVAFAVAPVLSTAPLERQARIVIAHWLVITTIVLLGWIGTAAATLASDFPGREKAASI